MFRMRRIATVRAVEPSLLVSIKRHDFRSFLSINAEVQAAVEAEVGPVRPPPPRTSAWHSGMDDGLGDRDDLLLLSS